MDGSDAYYDSNAPANTVCPSLLVGGCEYQGSATTTLPVIVAYVGVTTPPGNSSLGTIALFNGAGGTSFFNFPYGGLNGRSGRSYTSDYYNLGTGYTTVQVAWASTWEDNANDPPIKSVKDEACRPATLLNYIYNHYASAGKPMCAQAHSGGGAALGYSLAFYGADRSSGGYLDTVLFTSGPAISDIKTGCQYSLPLQPTGQIDVCSNNRCVGGASTPSFPDCLQYPNGDKDCTGALYPPGAEMYVAAKSISHATISDTPVNGNNCNNYTGMFYSTGPHDGDWAQMSLITGGTYNYPNTFVYGFLCSGPDTDGNGYLVSNDSAAQGWSYLSLLTTPISQNNGFPSIYRVDGCTDPEMIWGPMAVAEGTPGPQSGYDRSEQDMDLNCRNFHPQ
jgi:hypothetical protein